MLHGTVFSKRVPLVAGGIDGCLKDYTEIHGDINSPVMEENQWEVLSE
jgi:hypothetical protein